MVQLLEKEKDWVIGKKIKDIKADSQSIRIQIEDGYNIHIDLKQTVELSNVGTLIFKAVLLHQIGIPGRTKEKEKS